MDKRLKISRKAVSLSTAVVLLNSILSVSANAAGRSEFTLSADKSSVRAGDTVDVTVGLSPDAEGASGFTVCLHYDPNEVSVYVPASKENGFGGDGDFTVITNYNYSQGVVKIVGVDLNGGNITSDSVLAKARFTVLDGARGDLDYWLEVENIVRWDGGSYEYVSFSAPNENSPYSVDVEPSAEPVVTQTQAQTNPEPESAELAEIPTSFELPPVTEAPEPVAEEVTETEETYISEETEQSEWYYEEPEPSAESEYTEPVTEAVYTEVPEYTPPEVPQTFGEPVFSYFKDPSDENYTEDTVQYGFNAWDYITDTDISYDIKVYVSSTGYLNGVVGTDTDFGWDCAQYVIPDGGEQCWVYEDYDPKVSEQTVYLQVYYLSDYCGFDITGIEFIPRNGEWYVPEEIPESVTDQAFEEPACEVYAEPEVTVNEEEQVFVDEEYLTLLTDADVSAEPVYAPESTAESYAGEIPSSESTAEFSAAADTSSSPESLAESSSEIVSTAAESKASEASSSVETTSAPMREEVKPVISTGADTTASTPEKVLDKVDEASKQAENKSAGNANPNTGSAGDFGRKIFKGVYYASTAYLVYVIFALVYNRKKY